MCGRVIRQGCPLELRAQQRQTGSRINHLMMQHPQEGHSIVEGVRRVLVEAREGTLRTPREKCSLQAGSRTATMEMCWRWAPVFPRKTESLVRVEQSTRGPAGSAGLQAGLPS